MIAEASEHELAPDDFPVHWRLESRWADVDRYGHVNNATYYEYFDTAINAWIATALASGLSAPSARGVVAQSGCRFLSSVGFPDAMLVGIEAVRIGRSSITYRLGLFVCAPEGDDVSGHRLSAVCDWVHVYVDPMSHRPVPIPDPIRSHVAKAHRPRS